MTMVSERRVTMKARILVRRTAFARIGLSNEFSLERRGDRGYFLGAAILEGRMPVVVQNKNTSDISHIWLIVSRATAAVLGGYVVTYWTGAAVAKMAIEWDLLSPTNAGMFSGLIQLVVYVALIIGVCAAASMRKVWVVLAVLTALLVGVTCSRRGHGRTWQQPPHRQRSAFRRRTMEKSFTQRMGWLHTWFGLVLGWLAFALFLTGTLSVFWLEISHWAQPELHGAKMLSTPATVQYSLDYLRKVAPDSKRWNVYMPDFDRHPLLVLSWLDENDAQHFARLVPDGSGREVTTVTNGGRFFVDFHWTFNRVVPDLQGRTFGWAYMLSGLVGMAFLIGSITGLVIHKKIFRNFFTFRRDAKVAQTRWLDAHNVLGVLAWPFLFMIVLTGLVFYCYLYIPTGMQMAARYPAPPRVTGVPGVGGPGMLWARISSAAPWSIARRADGTREPRAHRVDRGSLCAGAGADGHPLRLRGQQSQP